MADRATASGPVRMLIGAILHPTELFALADGTGFLQHGDRPVKSAFQGQWKLDCDCSRLFQLALQTKRYARNATSVGVVFA